MFFFVFNFPQCASHTFSHICQQQAKLHFHYLSVWIMEPQSLRRNWYLSFLPLAGPCIPETCLKINKATESCSSPLFVAILRRTERRFVYSANEQPPLWEEALWMNENILLHFRSLAAMSSICGAFHTFRVSPAADGGSAASTAIYIGIGTVSIKTIILIKFLNIIQKIPRGNLVSIEDCVEKSAREQFWEEQKRAHIFFPRISIAHNRVKLVLWAGHFLIHADSFL